MTSDDFIAMLDGFSQELLREVEEDTGVWEKEIIGNMILHEHARDLAFSTFNLLDFANPVAVNLFMAIATLWRSGASITRETVLAEVSARSPIATKQEWSEAISGCLKAFVDGVDDGDSVGTFRTISGLFMDIANRRRAINAVGAAMKSLAKHQDRDGQDRAFAFRDLLQNAKRSIRYSVPDSMEGCLRDLKSVQDRIAAIQIRLAEEARVRRVADLRVMPYRQYLRSPEWLATRARMLVVAGDRCQVCNASGVTLNTHHRTYERLGEELNSDLFVLCADCHQIFHENGKLATA